MCPITFHPGLFVQASQNFRSEQLIIRTFHLLRLFRIKTIMQHGPRRLIPISPGHCVEKESYETSENPGSGQPRGG